MPFKSSLYWRGPVFWDFDGVNWTLPEDWDNRTRLLGRAIRSKVALDRELRWKSRPVRYTLRVMPNGGRWLYGLDVPAAPAPEAFISDEFQLLSIRKIDDQEPKFPMVAYLEYRIGSKLTDEQRARGLAWPEETNPRLRALGQELAAKYHETDEIVLQAFNLLATGGYQFDPGTMIPPGPDMLDRYFFDVKKGGAEYLAGSFAMLMRAAGAPSRLVSGYRGGTIVALTNFVIVKRADAHAWVEIWKDGEGWSRVEPKDIVLPPEKKTTLAQDDETQTDENAVEVEQAEEAPAPAIKQTVAKESASKSAESPRRQALGHPELCLAFWQPSEMGYPLRPRPADRPDGRDGTGGNQLARPLDRGCSRRAQSAVPVFGRGLVAWPHAQGPDGRGLGALLPASGQAGAAQEPTGVPAQLSGACQPGAA